MVTVASFAQRKGSNLHDVIYEWPLDTKFANFQDEATFVREVLRARPIQNLNQKSFPKNDLNEIVETTSNDAIDVNDIFPKSIPPSIYVDINGTLIISGKIKPSTVGILIPS